MHPRIVEMDEDIAKGAMEKESPKQKGNSSMAGQLPHRTNDPMIKDYDTDFPEPGNTPEYSMQKRDDQQDQNARLPDLHPKNDPDGNAEGRLNDQDPGHAQKRNQNDKKDDDLAA